MIAEFGCRPPTPEEQALVPEFDYRAFSEQRVTVAVAAAVTDWLGQYNFSYPDEDQSVTGCCTACALDVATMACALNQQGKAIPLPSLGFGYYSDTKDATFGKGSSVSSAAISRTIVGCCNDALYPFSWVMSHFRGGVPFDPVDLPKPECYADALTRKILRFSRVAAVAPDMALVDQLVNAGKPIAFGIDVHAMCILAKSADGQMFYCKDSKMPNLDIGFGRGMRGVTRNRIATAAYDLLIVEQVQIDGIATPPPQDGIATALAKLQLANDLLSQ